MNRKTKQIKNNKSVPNSLSVVPGHNVSSMINITHIKKDGEQKHMRGVTEKFFDTNGGLTSTLVGSITDLLPVPQGIDVNSRTGDALSIKQLIMHTDITLITLIPSNVHRIIIFQWHPSSALAVPTVTNILQTTNYNDFREFSNSKNYTVLWDSTYAQSGLTATSSTSSTRLVEMVHILPVKGFSPDVEFAPGATAGLNKIYALSISAVASAVTIAFRFRVIYTDQ